MAVLRIKKELPVLEYIDKLYSYILLAKRLYCYACNLSNAGTVLQYSYQYSILKKGRIDIDIKY